MNEFTPEMIACNSSTTGHRLSDIPEPHIRRYPGHPTEHRRVKVLINKYYGIGVHYYCQIEEWDNPIWFPGGKFPDGGTWCTPYDDAAGRGRVFHGRFDYLYQARKWIQETLAEYFSDQEYDITTDDYTDDVAEGFYTYPHEGG